MLLRSTSAAPGACQRPRTVQRSMYRAAPRSRRAVVAEARLYVEPFNGCNCYYLLSKSKKGDSYGNALVTRSLDQIQQVKLNVVRTWGFQDDAASNGPSNALQYMDMATRKIVYNQDMLDGLTWLLNEAQKRKLKLMLTLTNGNPPEYGGMRQYVRWAQTLRGQPEGGQDSHSLPNSAFFDDKDAQKLYQNYLTFIISKFKDHPAVHSWDIANEPRCSGDASGAKLTNWINETAAFVKTLDAKHPVTVGLDGYFGSSTPGLDSKNPYNNSPQLDGCDFVANNRSPNLDFACIHLYPMNWTVRPPANSDKTLEAFRAEWGVQWIKDHLDAINDASNGMNGIPLVLQEFNLSRWVNEPTYNPKICTNTPERALMFQGICDLLVKQIRTNGRFIGSMVWAMSDPEFSRYDDEAYYQYQPSLADEAKQLDPQHRVEPALNKQQMDILSYCSKQVDKFKPAMPAKPAAS